MSADAVLEDALREAGYAHVTAWHLRCVEAWAAQVAVTGWERPYSSRVTAAQHVETRLRGDLQAIGLDALHVRAQWHDAERTAARLPRVRPRALSLDEPPPGLADDLTS